MTDAPTAKRVPHERTHHGDTFVDFYAWLENKDDPEVIAHLEAENAYTAEQAAGQSALRERVFEEIKQRTQETDLSVPVRMGSYWYYSRTEQGKQYEIHCRRKVRPGETDPGLPTGGGPLEGEEIVLDCNAEAEGHDFFTLGTYDVSPDERLLAYSVDTSGDERFTLRFKDLSTGESLPEEISDTFYGSAWAADNSALFYITVDEAWRPYRVWRHVLGTEEDHVVYEETDERFWIGVGLTRSQEYIVIHIASKITSEIRVIPAHRPLETPTVVVHERVQGVELSLDHQGDRFLILHNENAENFTLGWVPVTDTADFHPILAHREDTRLSSVDAFRDHIVVSFRRDGLTGIKVIPNSGEPYDITFPDPIYQVELADQPEFPGGNPYFEATQLRVAYMSLVTPESMYDFDVPTGRLILRKRKEVLPGPDGVAFDQGRYTQHRLWATADDGRQIPISLVCPKGTPLDGSAPCILYGYGSYEESLDPWFSIPRLSVLNRGVVFAIAHVRGGGEMGRRWYEEGKFLQKKNTFTDFVSCARHLVKEGWTSPERLIARGGSAGGLLMGAIANLAPEAFGAILAEVPFVDPLSSVLDPSLPLTVVEWEEWGNPLESPEVYAYMRSYAPYENIADVGYPPILAVTSLNDTRVRYSEPAKWVAKLRELAPQGSYLLKTEMDAGHAGPSGRYDVWKEEAFNIAWMLGVFGIRE